MITHFNEAMPFLNEIRILPAETNQVPDIARLCTELGYPSSTEEVEQRLEHILRTPDHAVFVATSTQGDILGWVHIYEVRLLLVDRCAEIGGLIVSKSDQGFGVGTRLMEQAETWASEQGHSQVRIRSNIQREAAHQFYQDQGYSIEKTSHTLTKSLSL